MTLVNRFGQVNTNQLSLVIGKEIQHELQQNYCE